MPRNANFLARLEARMRAAGEAPAFEMADGEVLTYAQLIDEVARAAGALRSLGNARVRRQRDSDDSTSVASTC